MHLRTVARPFVALLALAIGLAAPADLRALPQGLAAEGLTGVPLAGITNDRDTSVSRLSLMLDGRADVRGIRMETGVPGGPAGADRDAAVETRLYPLERLAGPEGIVLGQGSGVKAILLRGTIDSRAGQGSLVVRYLTNGLLMTYRECALGLERSPERDWHLVNAYDGRPVTEIEIQTWMLGISDLKNVCPAV